MDNTPDPIIPGDDIPTDDPEEAIAYIRNKLESVATEHANGKLSEIQFYALYRHYTEKQLLIERLMKRNPESDAWRAVANSGRTRQLRQRFEARPLYFAVFQRDVQKPLLTEGKLPQNAAEKLLKVLESVMSLSNWRAGLARKSLGNGCWLLMAMGEESLTMTVFFMQPPDNYNERIRSIHSDFERANANALRQKASANKMVFPQRAILDIKS